MQLTASDFQAILIILLVVFIGINVAKKAAKFILFVFCLLCLYQTGYILSHTSINDRIPLDKYFKYDILSSISQIWEDTDKEALKKNIENTADTIVNTTGQIIDGVKDYTNSDNENQNTGNGANSENTENGETPPTETPTPTPPQEMNTEITDAIIDEIIKNQDSYVDILDKFIK